LAGDPVILILHGLGRPGAQIVFEMLEEEPAKRLRS
jgi:hypothetical protein